MTVEPSCPATPSGSGRVPTRSQRTRIPMKVAAMTRLADNHATRSPRQCDDGRDGGEVVAD